MEEGGLIYLLGKDLVSNADPETRAKFLQYEDYDCDIYSKQDLTFILPLLDEMLVSKDVQLRLKSLALLLHLITGSRFVLQKFKEIFKLPLSTKMIFMNQTAFKKKDIRIQQELYKNLLSNKEILASLTPLSKDKFVRIFILESEDDKTKEISIPAHYSELADPASVPFIFVDCREYETIRKEMKDVLKNENKVTKTHKFVRNERSQDKDRFVSYSPARPLNLNYSIKRVNHLQSSKEEPKKSSKLISSNGVSAIKKVLSRSKEQCKKPKTPTSSAISRLLKRNSYLTIKAPQNEKGTSQVIQKQHQKKPQKVSLNSSIGKPRVLNEDPPKISNVFYRKNMPLS